MDMIYLILYVSLYEWKKMITVHKLAGILSTFIASALAYFLVTIFSGYLQARVAKKLGDRTAEEAGFLTLNPAVYFDPIGFIAFLVFNFGWGKIVPINPLNFTGKHKQLEALFVFSSRAVANFILAITTLFIGATCLGGFMQNLPMPAFFVAHVGLKKALAVVILRMAYFSLAFAFFSFMMAMLRSLTLFGFSKFRLGEWHEAELVAVALTILFIYFFGETINIAVVVIMYSIEAFIWHWWSWLATLLGFISMYKS